MAKATFAAGCFWGVQQRFSSLPGVLATRVGFTGGHLQNPSYRQVCQGNTGHAEAVEVDFDPQQVSYQQLLAVFWEMHDPTTPDRQGPDIGSQYRSAIFCHDAEQRHAAVQTMQQQQVHYHNPIVTEISTAREFYPAEEYHQHYLAKQARGDS